MTKRIFALILLCLWLPILCHADGWFYGEDSTGGGIETIGYETAGTSGSTAITAGRTYISGEDTPVHSGTFQTIYIYSANTSDTVDVFIGLYEYTSGTDPDAAIRVGYIEFENPGIWSEQWKAFDVSVQSWPDTAGKKYYLAWLVSLTGVVSIYYDTDAGARHYVGNVWPNPYGTPDSSSTTMYSIKADISY